MVEQSHTAGWWPQLYEPLKGLGEKVADWFAPRSEASALQDCYEIDLELPGVKPEDIDIQLQDGQLTVKGEKRFSREEKGRSFFFSERQYGAFQRSFRLPADADNDQIAASFCDGVLMLKVPKSGGGGGNARKIEVRSG